MGSANTEDGDELISEGTGVPIMLKGGCWGFYSTQVIKI